MVKPGISDASAEKINLNRMIYAYGLRTLCTEDGNLCIYST